MKAVADTLAVARSNLIERVSRRACHKALCVTGYQQCGSEQYRRPHGFHLIHVRADPEESS